MKLRYLLLVMCSMATSGLWLPMRTLPTTGRPFQLTQKSVGTGVLMTAPRSAEVPSVPAMRPSSRSRRAPPGTMRMVLKKSYSV